MTGTVLQLGAVVVTLVLTTVVCVLLAGADPTQAFQAFVHGAFGGRRWSNLHNTLSLASLIVGMALAVMLAFRAGVFNLGGEGQLVLGGVFSAISALYLPGPAIVVTAGAILAGMAAGAMWATVAGALERWGGVPLIIGSLLLNYPASFFASYLVNHPIQDAASGLAQTARISRDVAFPNFPGTRLDIGGVFILITAIVVLVYCYRSTHGFRGRLVGLSPKFARASGEDVARIRLQTLAASGAIAGLVGAMAVLGIHTRYVDGMLTQPLYAWTGLVAVLLVAAKPWAVIPAGLFFAAIASGATGMERTADVPKEIALMIQAAVILAVAPMVARMSGVKQ